MKPSLKLIKWLLISVLALSACTKRNTSSNADKKKPLAARLADDTKKSSANSTPSPTPLPEPSFDGDGTLTHNPVPAETAVLPVTPPIDNSQDNLEPSVSSTPSTTTPSPSSLASASPPQTPATETTTIDTLSIFKKCLEDNVTTLVSTINVKAPREPTPGDFAAVKNTLLRLCLNKLGDQKEELDITQVDAGKIVVLESLRAFPAHEGTIKFFKAIEDNTSFSAEQKNKIYSAYGSGGEITSKDLQFFGKIEGSKASQNAISYLITHASGVRTMRVFTGTKEIKKTVLDLKTAPKPNNRYTFDFTPNAKNVYVLTISDGEAKIVTNVNFIKGDVKALREHQTVTVALTTESWAKVQEEHLRRLISKEAQDLITMPFSLEREQKNMTLVRTCNINAESIACSDPDFTSRAVVKPTSRVK